MSITDVGIYTVEDLHAYREQRDDMTVQLIDGELIVSPSPGVAHQVVSSELFVLLARAVPSHLRVLHAPLDLRAGERTVVQPDLMVVPRDLREGSEVEQPPVLAVDVPVQPAHGSGPQAGGPCPVRCAALLGDRSVAPLAAGVPARGRDLRLGSGHRG